MKDDLLEQFMGYCQQQPHLFADFHLVDEAKGKSLLASLLGSQTATHFTVIGKHASDSLIARWTAEELNPAPPPYVWLDSEGSPNSVFATTTTEFLSLLPFDTGAVYDIISSWTYYLAEPTNYAPPAEKYQGERLTAYFISAKNTYPAYSAFLAWLKDTLGISPALDPVGLIGNAIQKYPNLEEWLKNKK